MKTVYNGKTKTLLNDELTGDFYLFFKDDATGENGVFDPGSNSVGGSVSGKGKTAIAISRYFFELLEKNGIPTHCLAADTEKCLMKVRRLSVPKLEFVMRYFSAGSFCRRFSLEPDLPLEPPYTELTLKDDEQGDPIVSERICIMKGLLKEGEYEKAFALLARVGDVLRAELKGLGLQLLDFKVEIGFDDQRNMFVADEVTPDIWRVKDRQGNIPNQIDCAKLLLESLPASAAGITCTAVRSP
ncbi:MAG: phosphoribosylaminoimidazolesuccinocarboxamide synthase [Spirochaetes bacterium]|nr:phosphoribosylaminoimidazolesuccinocarboxamide synthase [Spirochaetota bacterium]